MSHDLAVLNVLIIDDDPRDRTWIQGLVLAFGVGYVDQAETIAQGRVMLERSQYNCVIVDMDFPGDEGGRFAGMAILQDESFATVFKIMLTIHPEDDRVALLRGARRFVAKTEVAESPMRLKQALYDAAFYVRSALEIHYQSAAMTELYRRVTIVARTDAPVLILGESGSGKELVARAVHKISARAGGPFETVNCACLDPHTAEADLFGVAQKAYTDVAARAGVFERADRGTIFFDEIGELGGKEQKKLLRILENPAELTRSGGHEPIRRSGPPVSFRCVFATDRDLAADVVAGHFHGPLHARIATHVLEVPPLNKRRDDIPLLTRLFFRKHQQDMARLSAEALEALAHIDWKGVNIRGLWNVLARALVLAETRADSASAPITARDIREGEAMARASGRPESTTLSRALADGTASLVELEAMYITQVLSAHQGRVADSARVLGIGRNTLYEKIRKYGLDDALASRQHADDRPEAT